MKDIAIEKAGRVAAEFCACIMELEMAESDLRDARGNRYRTSTKHRGALRRKSMDLTRALAEMRKP